MFDDAKVQKIVEIAKEKRKYFGISWNNIEQR
jgi:hypothetical protein